MKNLWFKLLVLTGLISLVSCGESGICTCKTACTVTVKGKISCSLDEKAFEKRKILFHETFTAKAVKVVETENGILFHFKDEGKLNEQLFKFILTEKKCCPFFQYDIRILPDNAGIQFTVSGNEEVKAFLNSLISTG